MSTTTTRKPRAEEVTAAIYHRVASARDSGVGEYGGGSSIHRQREATRRKAAEPGATIVEEFTDLGASGRTTNRPALQRLLAHIKTHDVTYCIVSDIDRLARDLSMYTAIREALTRTGVTLVLCEDDNRESPSSFVHEVISAMASYSDSLTVPDVSRAIRTIR